jgi:hypothetical protein
MQMLFAAMLIDALHAALEDAEISLNRVRMNVAANIFVCLVTHALMALEVITKGKVAAPLVSHHRGLFRDVGLNNRNERGRAHTVNMERANLLCLSINERKHSILMTMTAPLDGAFLAANECLVL